MPQLANRPLPILVASKHSPYLIRGCNFHSWPGARTCSYLNFRKFTAVTTTTSTYAVFNQLPVNPHPSVTIASISHSYANMASATSFYDFKPLDKKGQPYPLEDLKGKVVLIVNTASKCGFTPQFGGLETLYKEIKAEYPSAHPPQNPNSHRRANKQCAQMSSKSSASLATSSVPKTPTQTMRSKTSVRSTMACHSPCLGRQMLMVTRPNPYTSG